MKKEANPQASKKGLGYHSPTSIHLKIHKSVSNYIKVEDEGNKSVEAKSSIFDRLRTSTSHFQCLITLEHKQVTIQNLSKFLPKIDLES